MIGKFVLDAFDYYMLSALVVSYRVTRLNDRFSEKAKMKRLREDLISKSRLIESSSSRPGIVPKLTKIQKIYKVALDTRGGSNQELGYEFATKIQEFFLKLAAFLQDRKNQIILHYILSGARLVLRLMLSMYGIQLHYLVADPVSQQRIITAIVAGSTTGFVLSWIAAATTISIFPILLSIFTLRSSFQQVTHNREYAKLKDEID
jgi:hypothetical protein